MFLTISKKLFVLADGLRFLRLTAVFYGKREMKNKMPDTYTLTTDDNAVRQRGKETVLIKTYRELSQASQDTLIKVSKCMR